MNKAKLAGNEANKSLVFKCPGCNDWHTVPVAGETMPRWEWNGDLQRPTLSPSLLIRIGHFIPEHRKGAGEGCWCSYNAENPDSPAPFKCVICHSFVRDGRIEFLSDCTHELTGQTVELPEIAICERYFLSRDSSSHWYVVPVSKLEEWETWCNLDEDDERAWDVPKWAQKVGGSPSLVTFEAFEIS